MNSVIGVSAAVTAFATIVLAIITRMYVKFTGDMVKEMRAQLEELKCQRLASVQQANDVIQEMRAQLEELKFQRLASALPLVTGEWSSNLQSSGMAQWHASILNEGKGPALNLRIRLKVGEGWEDIDWLPVLSPGGNSKVTRSLSMDTMHEFELTCVDTCDRRFVAKPVICDPKLHVKYILEEQPSC